MASIARWRGDEAIAKAAAGFQAGLEAAAAHILARSQEIVPYDTGDLSDSGDSGLVSATVAAVTYTDRGAIDAHERTEVQAANGRQRKYLETPVNAERATAGRLIQQEISRALDE